MPNDPDAMDVRQMVSAVFLETEATAYEVDRLSEIARTELDALMQLNPRRRRLRVLRANSRFRNPILVDLLLDQSTETARSDPAMARDLAECAHEVALRLPEKLLGPAGTMTVIARCFAHRGNATRILGDLQAADPLLDLAQGLFESQGNQDPLVAAEIACLLASLRHAQRRFDEAGTALDRALALYTQCEDGRSIARTLIKQAIVLAEAGETERAAHTVQNALDRLDPVEDQRLYLMARHNLAIYLEDLDRHEEAWGQLESLRGLYESYPEPWTRLRYLWSVGTVSRGLGRLDRAEHSLELVRRGLLDQGLVYDAALAGLDLALVYVERRRYAELRHLAQEMIPVFLAQDIQREAITALLLFQEAARREAVTAEMLHSLRLYMKRVRTDRQADR